MGFVAEAALIALREGLEAFLIVGILLGLVIKLGRPDAKRWVWLGLGTGITASILVGVLVQQFLLEPFEQNGGAEWFELAAALAAVGVLTYMVFWMWKHTRGLMATLHRKVSAALNTNTTGVIIVLVFVSVLREGLEVVLFYGALAGRYDSFSLVWSGLLGTVASVAIVVAILKTTLRFDLQKFFAITGILLVFVAAGLLVHSVHAASDLGLIDHADAVWDTSGAVSDDSAAGRILHALMGYTSQPTLLQAVLYFSYLFGVGLTYLATLGAFTARSVAARRSRIAAAVCVVLLAVSMTTIGALNPVEVHHDEEAQEATNLEQAAAALEEFDGKVGLLVRHHGEPVHYNATTYESFKAFIDSIWPYTGLPPELLLVDQGTILIDDAHPYDDQLHPMDARLVDAWLGPYSGLAVPAADPLGASTVEEDLASGQFYLAPGTGPGLGEGDMYEMLGLATYRDWLKMDNQSPMYGYVQDAWSILEDKVQDAFGDKVVVAFAHHVDPKVDPQETTEAAARKLADAQVDLVVDVYMSSIHSDAMNTCMMAPHTEHALREAGYTGPVVSSGMAGTHATWAEATAAEVERLVGQTARDAPVAVYLSQHGGNPMSPNPCGPEGSTDQYAANTRLEYDLAEAAVKQRLGDSVIVRHVYGQGAGSPDDGVLSPLEALALDHDAVVRDVVILPYEFWGNSLDNLVYLRESLGFQPEEAPYYGADYSTRLTRDGMSIQVASAAFGTEAKVDALLARIAEAILDGVPSEAGAHTDH